MPPLTRNALVLRYLVDQAPGIGRVKLAKFAYLADLEARRYLGKPITGFRYVYDQHGPFDAKPFYAALDELTDQGFVTTSQVPCGPYVGYEIRPTARVVEYDFDLAESEVLSFVARTYLTTDARELCEDVVYQTPPMQEAKPGKPLPMERMNRKIGDGHAFDLHRMLAGEASAEAGRTRPLGDALDELRDRHH